MPIEVTIATVDIAERKVTLPDKCLVCEADLTQPGALTHWEYQDQRRTVSVKDDEIDWDDVLPTSGESFIPLEWRCTLCSHKLHD